MSIQVIVIFRWAHLDNEVCCPNALGILTDTGTGLAKNIIAETGAGTRTGFDDYLESSRYEFLHHFGRSSDAPFIGMNFRRYSYDHLLPPLVILSGSAHLQQAVSMNILKAWYTVYQNSSV